MEVPPPCCLCPVAMRRTGASRVSASGHPTHRWGPIHSPDGTLADFVILLASPAPQGLEEGGFFFLVFLSFRMTVLPSSSNPPFNPTCDSLCPGQNVGLEGGLRKMSELIF